MERSIYAFCAGPQLVVKKRKNSKEKEMKKLIAILSVVFFANQASAESTVLSSKGAHALCTTEATHWVDFCNGLIQGYADYASLSGAAMSVLE